MHRGAPCTVVSPCRCLVTPVVRPSRQCPSACSAELSWLRIGRWRLAGGACGRRPSGRASLRRPGMLGAGHAVRRRPASTVGCPPIRFPRPGPVVQPSGVRSAGSVVRGPTVRCPVIWCPPVRPVTSSSVSARRWPTLQPGRIGLQVVCGSRAAWSTARVGLEGAMLWSGGRPVGERRSRTWPGGARAQAATVLDRWPAGEASLACGSPVAAG